MLFKYRCKSKTALRYLNCIIKNKINLFAHNIILELEDLDDFLLLSLHNLKQNWTKNVKSI